MTLAEKLPTYPKLSLAELLRNPPDPEPFFVTGLLPKQAKLLMGGAAKIGKSFTAWELGKSLTCGLPAFHDSRFGVPEPSTVLILDRELHKGEIHKRSIDIMGDTDISLYENRLYYLTDAPKLKLDAGPIGLEPLVRLIEEIQPNVFMIDPISSFMLGSDSDNGAVAKLFDAIDGLMERFKHNQMSIVMAHHYNKPLRGRDGEDDDRLSPYNFRGASKWYDSPDVLVTMDRKNISDEAWAVESRIESRRGGLPFGPDKHYWYRVAPRQFGEVIRWLPDGEHEYAGLRDAAHKAAIDAGVVGGNAKGAGGGGFKKAR